MFGLGPMEITVIVLIFLMLFGFKRLPQMAKDLGAGLKEFKKAGREVLSSDDEEKGDNSNGKT